ncbi:hypothetical protein EJ05DRAFT_536588 [Pseudovirgaria hyperparasitica]|uniref:Uncharacterized protein n=1 Tax=Pseudovirgaria hyperparasitica TaxID=470096 RepID=A0A6A6WCD0_9PEZI|nr:uncharacterized protein EJ05DRAFT_536588 [Pseudovirgaria hyperparasitica]KAF2760488.1 hypothetical protein EJ05DRAFT_536588 [Pseudovirgaria hyperparasitica]
MAQQINILLTTFTGLGLPPTLSFAVSSSTSVAKLGEAIAEHLPAIPSRLIVTTNRNRQLEFWSREEPITTLLSSPNDTFLPLRLSVPLCGGKGGFGSQLRAAGGRMSSRKKRKQGDEHASSRNLDGRRLRTVAEAKALAEYLAIKPDMEKKEKEERKKRWESIVEMADKREEEIRNGRGRLDGKWVESKEEASERTREAVLAAMKAGDIQDALGAKESDSSGEASGTSDGSDSEMEVEESGASSSKPVKSQTAAKTFFGWDDEDEDMSDEDEEADVEESGLAEAATSDKGKGKATE